MTAPTIPTAPAELEEMLADPARLQALVGNPEEFGEFVQNYARAVHAKDKDIAAQVREETSRVLAELLETDRKEAAKLNLKPGTTQDKADKGQRANRRAIGAGLDNVYDDAADFLQAVWHDNRLLPNREDLQNKATEARRIQNSYGSVVPSDGGFLIPETLRSELLRVALETAVVRSRARVIPMESLRVPIPSVDSTSNASNVYGGVTAYWTEEAATLTESSASFGRVVLDAKKLTAYSEIPNELLADASALSGFFTSVFPEALAWFEDIAFIGGSGAGEPLGFLNNTSIVSVTKETNQVAATIVWENIVKAYSRMLPSSLGRAVWLANLDTFPQLATMALSVGTGGSAIWLNNGAEGPPMTILGRPVIFTEKLPTVGTTGDIIFADLGYYLIGDRQAIQATSSPHYKFANDKTAYRIIERVDGRPWLQSPITPNKGSNTLSPFVQLATRS